MLYVAMDMEKQRVTDIMLGGDAAVMYRELIALYNQMTGETRHGFASLEEAKRMTTEAVHARYFGPSAREVRSPAPPSVPPLPEAVRSAPTVKPPWEQVRAAPWSQAPTPATPPAVEVVREEAHEEPQHGEPEVMHPGHDRENGPVARARRIFESMPGAPRKDILDACAKVGIKRSTASTQFQAWKKAKEEAREYRNPENGMPQLAPGVQVTQH